MDEKSSAIIEVFGEGAAVADTFCRKHVGRGYGIFLCLKIQQIKHLVIVQCSFVIAEYCYISLVTKKCYNFFRIGAIANKITQADDCLGLVFFKIFDHRLKSFQITVNIREDSSYHGLGSPGEVPRSVFACLLALPDGAACCNSIA